VPINRKMGRRQFLFTANYFFFGSLFGLNSFSKVLASENHKNEFLFQPRIALIIDDIEKTTKMNSFFNHELP
jgi:hypothetical protein